MIHQSKGLQSLTARKGFVNGTVHESVLTIPVAAE